MSTYLYTLDGCIEGKVIKRPCKTCRSPYVADVLLQDNTEVIAHAPSLGCCGYADAEQDVILVEHKNPKKCTHVIHLAKQYEKNSNYLIGIHPKSAEHIVSLSLTNGCIKTLEHIENLEREKKFLNSRFDFICFDKDKRKTIIEVKNVPCADYEDIEHKERKKMDFSSRDINSKIAYFPDGYRKKKTDTVSPRALKHIQELEELKKTNKEYRCILIFVIQRNDITHFQASNLDPLYKNALYSAFKNGVEVIPIQVHWEESGNCYYDKIVPFHY